MKPLEQEIEFFEANESEWRKIYLGKFVLVKDQKLIGTYEKPEDAISAGARLFGTEPFLVRPVTGDNKDVYIPALALGLLSAHIT